MDDESHQILCKHWETLDICPNNVELPKNTFENMEQSRIMMTRLAKLIKFWNEGGMHDVNNYLKQAKTSQEMRIVKFAMDVESRAKILSDAIAHLSLPIYNGPELHAQIQSGWIQFLEKAIAPINEKRWVPDFKKLMTYAGK